MSGTKNRFKTCRFFYINTQADDIYLTFNPTVIYMDRSSRIWWVSTRRLSPCRRTGSSPASPNNAKSTRRRSSYIRSEISVFIHLFFFIFMNDHVEWSVNECQIIYLKVTEPVKSAEEIPPCTCGSFYDILWKIIKCFYEYSADGVFRWVTWVTVVLGSVSVNDWWWWVAQDHLL